MGDAPRYLPGDDGARARVVRYASIREVAPDYSLDVMGKPVSINGYQDFFPGKGVEGINNVQGDSKSQAPLLYC